MHDLVRPADEDGLIACERAEFDAVGGIDGVGGSKGGRCGEKV